MSHGVYKNFRNFLIRMANIANEIHCFLQYFGFSQITGNNLTQVARAGERHLGHLVTNF